MNRSLSLLAPAKLNLFLHITGRRGDGYHNLQTVFQLLDYGDDMYFSTTDVGGLSLHSQQIKASTTASDSKQTNSLPMDHNLILQAARALKAYAKANLPDQLATNTLTGIAISINKRLPMGGGLGGGSANAAMTLVALNHLWQLGLERQQLSNIGLTLGADVAVFIGGQSAWAEGVGEQLKPVELPHSWYVVITPNCSVSTAEIFSHEQLTRDSQAIKMADLLAGQIRNDCESVTRKLYPAVDAALKWLANHGEARMTGTGSSVFARFEDESSARAVLAQLSNSMLGDEYGLDGFVAKGINKLDFSYSDK